MPKFVIYIEREYNAIEGFTRTIEADTETEAEKAAWVLAAECDNDCPDDCSEIGVGATGGFYVNQVRQAGA